MSDKRRRLERLETLVPEAEDPEAAAASEEVRWALDRVALLRVRQRVAPCDLVAETEGDERALVIFESLRSARRGGG